MANPFQSMPNVQKIVHLVRMSVVVKNFTMDQPLEKVKPLEPLLQLVEVDDKEKVIIRTKVLNGLLSNQTKIGPVIVTITDHPVASMDRITNQG